MKMLRKKIPALTFAIVLSATMAGCTTVQQYAAGGALIGGLTGNIWARNYGPYSRTTGGFMGAMTGATIGALVGDAVEYHGVGPTLAPARNDVRRNDVGIEHRNDVRRDDIRIEYRDEIRREEFRNDIRIDRPVRPEERGYRIERREDGHIYREYRQREF